MIERPLPPPSSVNDPKRFLLLPVWILAVFACGLLMVQASTVCLWIACSFFLFVLLDPTAQSLKSKRWPTAWTALFLILFATVLVGGLLFVLGSLSAGMAEELETSKKIFLRYYDSLSTSLRVWIASMTHAAPAVGEVAANTKPIPKVEVVQNSPFGGELGSTVMHGLGSAVTVMTFALLVPILSFFILAERDSMAKVIEKAYIDPTDQHRTWKAICAATKAYFLGNLILALVTFPLFLLLFWIFSVPSLFTLAALSSVFNLIPFLGSVLSGFLPALTLVGQYEKLGPALILYGICALSHFAVANFVTPKVLGSKVDINATTSTIALIAWGELWGGVGLILAIPLTALIKILFEHSNFFWLQWIAALMSEDADRALKPSQVNRSSMASAPN